MQDDRVRVIELSRNFGHHKAIMTGLSHTKGKFIFLIDSDLEEEPELLSKFWEEIQEDNGVDVVYGVQESRKGNWFERWSGKLFYKVRDYASSVGVPHNIVTARLFNRKALDAVLSYHERELCMSSIFHNVGFAQKELKIQKKSLSSSTYSFTRKLALVLNSIVSFSNRPLNFILGVGLLITFFSAMYIIYTIICSIFFNSFASGWTSVIISIWFFGGLLSTFIGILGLYISKIFIEVKNRPYTIVKNAYGGKER